MTLIRSSNRFWEEVAYDVAAFFERGLDEVFQRGVRS